MLSYGPGKADHASAREHSRGVPQQVGQRRAKSPGQRAAGRWLFQRHLQWVQLLLLPVSSASLSGYYLPMTAGLQYYCLSSPSVIFAIRQQIFVQCQGFAWQAVPLSGYFPQLMRHVKDMCWQAESMCMLGIMRKGAKEGRIRDGRHCLYNRTFYRAAVIVRPFHLRKVICCQRSWHRPMISRRHGIQAHTKLWMPAELKKG